MNLSLLIILFIAYTLQEKEWKLIKDKDGVKVHNRPYQNNDYKETKGVTNYKGSIKSLVSLIKDSPRAANWVSRVKDFRTIYEVDATKWFSYTEISMPFPYLNRDLVTYNEIIEQKSIQTVIINITSTPEVVGKQAKILRITKAGGFWQFKQLPNNEVEITYQFYSEPQIDLPRWFVEPLVANGIIATLSKMKIEAKKYDP